MGARIDILKHHADEAAFLYARLRRSCRLLDGNAKQTRSLLARLDAHVDALTLFARDAKGLLKPPAEATDTAERFVATAVAAATGDGLAELAGTTFGYDRHLAMRDAMLRYATGETRGAVDAWIAEGGDAARGVGVELLARWRDPRAEKVASRAVRRGSGALRAVGVCALGRLGVDVGGETLRQVMIERRAEATWCEEMLHATLHASTTTALECARRWVQEDDGRCDMAWVLLGLTGDGDDLARLLDALTIRGAIGALPAAVALAGAHPALDPWWEGAEKLAVSNALREAAYVVLGGEVPPVVVRDEMAEEPEDVAQRAAEDAALREATRAASGGAWRWGMVAGDGAWGERVAALGPRHRRWGEAALRVGGTAVTGTPARV